MRFVNCYRIRTRLLHLIQTVQLDVSELTRTVNGSEPKLFFRNVVWVIQFSLDSDFAETQPFKGSLVHKLPMRNHVIMSHHRRYLTIVIHSSMRVTLSLAPEGTFLCFNEMILRRENNAFIGL